jgi:hypothetical protein
MPPLPTKATKGETCAADCEQTVQGLEYGNPKPIVANSLGPGMRYIMADFESAMTAISRTAGFILAGGHTSRQIQGCCRVAAAAVTAAIAATAACGLLLPRETTAAVMRALRFCCKAEWLSLRNAFGDHSAVHGRDPVGNFGQCRCPKRRRDHDRKVEKGPLSRLPCAV